MRGLLTCLAAGVWGCVLTQGAWANEKAEDNSATDETKQVAAETVVDPTADGPLETDVDAAVAYVSERMRGRRGSDPAKKGGAAAGRRGKGPGLRSPSGRGGVTPQSRLAKMRLAKMKERFEQVDTDDNGKLSKKEVIAAVEKMFDRVDSNDDGELEKSEIGKVAQAVAAKRRAGFAKRRAAMGRRGHGFQGRPGFHGHRGFHGRMGMNRGYGMGRGAGMQGGPRGLHARRAMMFRTAMAKRGHKFGRRGYAGLGCADWGCGRAGMGPGFAGRGGCPHCPAQWGRWPGFQGRFGMQSGRGMRPGFGRGMGPSMRGKFALQQRAMLVKKFKELDKDDDGKLSKSEAPERLAEHFERIDRNKDGQLEPRELRALRMAMARRRGGPMRDQRGPRANDSPSDRPEAGKGPGPGPGLGKGFRGGPGRGYGPGAGGPPRRVGPGRDGPQGMRGPHGPGMFGPRGPHGPGMFGPRMMMERLKQADKNDDGFVDKEEVGNMIRKKIEEFRARGA